MLGHLHQLRQRWQRQDYTTQPSRYSRPDFQTYQEPTPVTRLNYQTYRWGNQLPGTGYASLQAASPYYRVYGPAAQVQLSSGGRAVHPGSAGKQQQFLSRLGSAWGALHG